MGFGFFATTHGVMTLAGFAGRRSTAIVQMLYGGMGGTGCFINAAYSGGAERNVGIGCGVISSLAFLCGQG